MPIPLTFPVGGSIGPGISVVGQSSFLGTVPPGSSFQLTVISVQSGQELSVAGESLQVTRNSFQTQLSIPETAKTLSLAQGSALDGTTVRLNIRLILDSGAVVDEDNHAFTWAASSSLYQVINAHATPGGHDPMLDTILAAVQRTLQSQA